MSSDDAIERLSTGISGFDQVALGGLPAGRSTLVTGTTGSGKTLFAVEFLAHGVRAHGQAGVFVTFEETAAAIRRRARRASPGMVVTPIPAATRLCMTTMSSVV